MHAVKSLTPSFAVSPALGREDFAAVRALGFATVINFRPDNESAEQISDMDARRAAEAAGLAYVQIPVSKFDVFAEDVVKQTAAALLSAPTPILAYCASGQRAAMVWAAAAARAKPVDTVLKALKSAGLDFGFLRDDLEAQAGRKLWDEHATYSSTVALPLVAA